MAAFAASYPFVYKSEAGDQVGLHFLAGALKRHGTGPPTGSRSARCPMRSLRCHAALRISICHACPCAAYSGWPDRKTADVSQLIASALCMLMEPSGVCSCATQTQSFLLSFAHALPHARAPLVALGRVSGARISP